MVEATVTPLAGNSHGLLIRAQGVMRHYLVGFDGENQVSFICNNFEYKRLISVRYEWEVGKSYRFRLVAADDKFTLYIDDVHVLEHRDETLAYGMFGFGSLSEGETLFSDVHVVVDTVTGVK